MKIPCDIKLNIKQFRKMVNSSSTFSPTMRRFKCLSKVGIFLYFILHTSAVSLEPYQNIFYFKALKQTSNEFYIYR